MTLVELLVGLALFGLLATLGLAQLQGGLRLWHAADARAAAMQRTEAVHTALRRLLEDSALLAEPDGTTAAFFATPDRVRWVGRAPSLAMTPGLYVLDLALVDGRLVLGWRAHAPGLALAAHAPEEALTLLDGIATGSFRVFGDDGSGRTTWHEGWAGVPRAPRLVRIDLQPGPAARWRWPPLVIAIGPAVEP